MIKSITVKPDTRTADILFFQHVDFQDRKIIPLFGPNGVGKSTLIKELEKHREILLTTDGIHTECFSYQNARDNYKDRQPRSYMEAFDPYLMSAKLAAQSISEGQSIIYSMFDLLDGLRPNGEIPQTKDCHKLILLDEIDSGMSIDNIDITMRKIRNLIRKRSDLQFIFSFNSPRILKHFPEVLSMYDGTFITLHSDEDMLAEINKHKKVFDKIRKNSKGRPKVYE